MGAHAYTPVRNPVYARLRYAMVIRGDKEVRQEWYEQCEPGQVGNDQKEALPVLLDEIAHA